MKKSARKQTQASKVKRRAGSAAATTKKLRQQLAEVRARLEDANEALRALRSGEVDAVVVHGPEGERVFTLNSAERAYRILVEAMSEGAATLGENGIVLYANVYLARMLDRPLEQVIGARLEEFLTPPHREDLPALMRGAHHGEAKKEVTFRTPDDRNVPAYLALSAMMGEEGHPLLCLAVTDLSAQKKSEEMVASERLARAVLDQVGEGMVVCDADGRIIRASRGVERLLGASPVHRRFEEVFPQSALGELTRNALGGADAGGVACTLDTEDFAVHVLASAAPLRGEENRILGAIVTMTNVTALLDTQKRLEEAVRARDEFLSIASHELRTPLTALKLKLQLLERALKKAPSAVEGKAVESLAVASRQADRIGRLISALLDISRIKTGRFALEPTEFDLTELTRETVEQWSDEARRAGGELHFHEAPPGPGYWDRLRIEQALINLLSNALKYGNGQPVDVRMHVSAEEIAIDVEDRGMGIAPADQQRVFGQFERAVAVQHFGGLGLGLFIAQEIAAAHGGAISVRSDVGVGSCFTLRLPRKQSTPIRPNVLN